jgi:cysteinyl-tRNA synthetase
MLKIYNTLTGSKDVFRPIEPGKVRIYVCGMTVYDYCHLGHARVMVVFDMVTRYLRARGYEVNYVRNITDIDDKIINRAVGNNESIESLTGRFIEAMNEDADALAILRPDQEPRATEYIDEIIAMIEKLIKNSYAYVADNGDVFYDVSKFKPYGRLSGKKTEELRAGARVDVSEAKDDPLDFALWKAAKQDEPSWESPWGPGRPGWHIECSAMSTRCLGEHFDIHGGGQDLQFPHHENEIAQSTGATGKPFVNVWMHNGFVRVDEEKMSKSLGNFFTIREILKQYPPEVVRFFILSSHYRSPLNYTEEHINAARASLARLYTSLRDISLDQDNVEKSYQDHFYKVMDDDFNTPEAVSLLHDIAHEINRVREEEPERARLLARTLRHLGGILGILQDSPEKFLQSGEVESGYSPEEIDTLIKQRARAKQQKDFNEADRIRDLLAGQGIVLEDTPQGTTWRRN